MAKKLELLEQAKKLKLDVTNKNTIIEIEAAIKTAVSTAKPTKKIKKVEKEVEKVEKQEVATDDIKLAKAGKRSEKAIKEVVEKIAKEERKEKHDTTPKSENPPGSGESKKKKGSKPITRPLIERRGKKYRKAAELIDKNTAYSLSDAMDLVTKTSPSKFDASVEIHVRLSVDPRQADQNVRATVNLPNGTGKTIRVAVFAPDSEHAAAKKAGADIIGDEDFLRQLDKETIDFGALITTPQYMPKLGKYARLLGPRGLMPNPKGGSVTTNITKAIIEAKAGKVEYRVDKQSIVHLSIGKISFGAKKLEENALAFFESLKSHKPTSLKGTYIKTISICTTQGPSIKTENVIN